MLFIIALIVSIFIVFTGRNALKKYPYIYYIAAAAVTVTVIAITQSDIHIKSEFVNKYILGIFSKGAFAGALWCIVMFTGAVTTDSKAGKKLVSVLMPIRGELSIFAAVVTMSHSVTYGLTYLRRFSLMRKSGVQPKTDFIMTCIVCIALLLIMIPLTVMSVKAIRKKMNAKLWKNIQRAAYIFYALIFIHIIILYIPQAKNGISEKYMSVIVYSAVFTLYAAMRIRKALIKKLRPEKPVIITVLCLSAAALCTLGIAIYSHGEAPVRKIPEVKNTPQNVVTTAVTTAVTAESDESQANTTVSTEKDSKKDVTTTVSDVTETTAATDEDEEASTTETSSEPEDAEEETAAAEENVPEEQPIEEEHEEVPVTEATQPPTEPEPVYVYKNGTFSGIGVSPSDFDGKDYEGTVYAEVTIENDIITNIELTFEGDDAGYPEIAGPYVKSQVIGKDNADGIDARCGATRSAQGAAAAIKDALSQAKN